MAPDRPSQPARAGWRTDRRRAVGRRGWSALLVALTLAGALLSGSQALAPRSFADRIDEIWLLIGARYWPPTHLAEIGWEGLRAEFIERASGLASEQEFTRLARELTDRVGDDHTAYLPVEWSGAIRPRGERRCPPAGREACAGEPVWSQLLTTPLGPAAYIRVEDLIHAWAPGWVRESLLDLERDGAVFIALDLRGNPGGAAAVMSDLAGVFVRGVLWRLIGPMPTLLATTGPQATALPLVVLVDADTHSAAEGLAGGLQRVGRALVAGQLTAGNLEALLPYRLQEGGLLLIAEGRLAPLQGQGWDRIGVRPDIHISEHLDLHELMSALALALGGGE